MQIRLKPWTENERLYFYRQSQQLSGQTGQIGKLRADFDRDGTGFFSTWEDIRPDLKTDDFKNEFDKVINALRFETDGTPLGGRRSLSAFLSRQDGAKLPGDEEWHGFRADTDNYSYFFRLKPHAGDYNVYVWCYKRDWLDEHMARAERGIRFIDSGYNDKFTIPDGGRIRINFPDGTSEEKTCRYIDDTHVQFGDGSGAFGLQHICEFAERIENIGATVEPVTEPMVKLTERFYCPLKFVVFDRDEYGDLEDDGDDLDGRYATRYEDEIRELLKKEHSYEGCDLKSMARYQDNPKVLSAEWDVQEIRGTLYGMITVELAAPLSLSEEKELKAWISGQNSDGFGEGFEQQEIETGDGVGYLSFWNSGNNYFIKNETEFRKYLNSNQYMGGVQL
jgi:hypothetical protein